MLLLLVLFFAFVGYRVTKALNLLIHNAETDGLLTDKRMIEDLKIQRRSALQTMWFIIGIMLFVCVFELIYSSFVAALYSPDCYN